MITIELLYFVTFVSWRPNIEVKNNIIDNTNEVFFIIMLPILIYFNSPEKWSFRVELAYIYLIMSKSAVILTIMFGRLLIKIQIIFY